MDGVSSSIFPSNLVGAEKAAMEVDIISSSELSAIRYENNAIRFSNALI